MKKQSVDPPPKPMAIQTRVILSMLYQIKDRVEIKKWMKPQDVYESHRRIFDYMLVAIQEDYNLSASLTHALKAIELLMAGMPSEEFL